jgi:hypothetical protein
VEYLSAHPDGRFNESIRSGRVAVGMNFEDVLAAWGIPDTRIRNASREEERWLYVLADPWSHDSVGYDFVFVKRELTSWETTRNVASSQYLYPQNVSARAMPPVASAPSPTTASGSPRR